MNIYAAVPKMYKRIRYTVHAHAANTHTHKSSYERIFPHKFIKVKCAKRNKR